MTKNLLLLTLIVVVTSNAVAQNPLSVSRLEADNSVAAALKSFTLAEGYEANLFADETDGVANPVCMSWDPAGRLWVLCTWVYPQLKPAEKPDDKLLILTDTNGDGRADKTIVFADGLNMPTGFALGHGGAYIGQGSDLLHLEDIDGDDKADTRRVLLTGFGTGDTHQNINSFTWSPGGELFFCQGLHWDAAQAFASQLGIANRVASIKWYDINEDDDAGLEPAYAESLRKAIRQKNDLWFRYWRPTNWAFLYGNRQSTASSRDHTNPSRRWFPEELQSALPHLEEAELRIQEAAAGTVREKNK